MNTAFYHEILYAGFMTGGKGEMNSLRTPPPAREKKSSVYARRKWKGRFPNLISEFGEIRNLNKTIREK